MLRDLRKEQLYEGIDDTFAQDEGNCGLRDAVIALATSSKLTGAREVAKWTTIDPCQPLSPAVWTPLSASLDTKVSIYTFVQ